MNIDMINYPIASPPESPLSWSNVSQPAFGAAEEKLELFISRGIINWGEPVQGGFSLPIIINHHHDNETQGINDDLKSNPGVLDDGELLIQQAASASGDGMVR